MNRGIFTTANGMVATQKALDLTAHNLSNVNTTGFKRNEANFAEAFEREIQATSGYNRSLGTLGTGATMKGEFQVFSEGEVSSTGNPLDLAVRGEKGMFLVQNPNPGPGRPEFLYTRNGSFHLDDSGTLVNSDGFSVLDDSQSPIQIPPGKLVVGKDGSVSVDGQEIAKIGLFDGGFQKSGTNYWTSPDAQVIDLNGEGNEISIASGALEGSNVSAVEEMLRLITLNRSFELSQKSIQQQDEMTGRLLQSLQDR